MMWRVFWCLMDVVGIFGTLARLLCILSHISVEDEPQQEHTCFWLLVHCLSFIRNLVIYSTVQALEFRTSQEISWPQLVEAQCVLHAFIAFMHAECSRVRLCQEAAFKQVNLHRSVARDAGRVHFMFLFQSTHIFNHYFFGVQKLKHSCLQKMRFFPHRCYTPEN